MTARDDFPNADYLDRTSRVTLWGEMCDEIDRLRAELDDDYFDTDPLPPGTSATFTMDEPLAGFAVGDVITVDLTGHEKTTNRITGITPTDHGLWRYTLEPANGPLASGDIRYNADRRFI